MLYLLKKKCGNHRVGKKTYKSGAKIESDLDLVKLFPGKFELVTVPVQTADGISPNIPIPGDETVTETKDETEKTEEPEIAILENSETKKTEEPKITVPSS